MSQSNLSRLGLVPAVLGLVVIGTYLTTAAGYFPGPEKLQLVLFFAIGPLAIVGTLAIRRRLLSGGDDRWADVGAVFLVIGFAFFDLMLVVQQYVRLRAQDLVVSAGEAVADASAAAMTPQQTLRDIWKIVDFVQQGIDVSFDIFYCLGVVLLAAAMFRHPDFGKLLGAFGMLSAAALLALNLGAFPQIPGESGLIDLGPVTGVWWLLVIVQMVRLDRRERRARVVAAAD
jgi:hypothetical protein